MVKALALVASLFLVAAGLSAQSRPSAEGGHTSVWIGSEVSTFNPDWGCSENAPWACLSHQLLGVSPFVDANHLLFPRLGAEAQARFLHWRGPEGGLTEDSYLFGPRFGVFHFKGAYFSAKVMAGTAHINVPPNHQGSGNYFAFAPGGTVDFRIRPRLFARVGYEYQIWPGFKGDAPNGSGGLTPNGFSAGLSYAVIR